MGGKGSGTWYRGNKRITCEETRRIDIRFLRRCGMLRPNSAGRLHWTYGDEPNGEIRYTMYNQTMRLSYRVRWPGEDWEGISHTIWFDETVCNFGGTRKWFLCPGCGRRVAVLYLGDSEFECRKCCRLVYASQGEGYLDRMSRKLNKMSNKLGADCFADLITSGKPKYMHSRTYNRLVMEAIDLEERMNKAFESKYGFCF